MATRGPPYPGRYVVRPACAGADAWRPPARRDPVHAQPRGSHPRTRRGASIQQAAAAKRFRAIGDARTNGRSATHVRVHLRSRTTPKGGGIPKIILNEIVGPFSLGAVDSRPRADHARLAAHPRVPHGVVRVPDRLQRDPRRVVGAARRACGRWWSMRCASGRTRRTSACPRRSRPPRASAPSARTSRTSVTTWRTPRRARACPRGVELAYDGLVLEMTLAAEYAELAGLALRACELAANHVAHGHHSFSRRSASVPLEAAGARARQFRRRPSRTPEDSRAAAPRRQPSAARTSVVMTFDPHPPRDRSSRQGAAAADDQGAEARSDRRGAASRAPPSCVSRGSCRCGIRKRSCRRCWWTGSTCPRCGSARIFSSATIAAGNFTLAARARRALGFKAEKIDPVRYKDFVVSSTRIRRLISEGRMDEAGALLGHQYYIDGVVVEGDRRGPDDRISDGEPSDGERAAAAKRRLCDDRDGERRRACRR